jgi:dUTP pyrophosphatase
MVTTTEPSTVQMYLNPALVAVLADNNVETYAPAYGGESVGLDLYNAGPDMLITAAYTSVNANNDPFQLPLSEWDELPEAARKAIFKCLIPTGLHLNLAPNTVALLRERSSVTKTPLVLRAGVIDPGYTGEIYVNAVNVGYTDYVVKAGARLPFQLIVTPCLTDFAAVNLSDYESATTMAQRATGAFGSSD